MGLVTVTRAGRLMLAGLFSAMGSSFLEQVRRSVVSAFDHAGEVATHTDSNGTSRQVTVIRMQNNAKPNPAGYAFEDEGPWCLVKDYGVLPIRDEHLHFEGESDPRVIVNVENHNLRGYLRVTVSDL